MYRSGLSRFIFLSLSCFLFPLYAQALAYLYIQGDKQTPIYVKIEGVMVQRYGKHYALIPKLAPGPMNVEILFQQNIYPPLHFTIMVPEQGCRAFLINKKGDKFSLYDLQQNFYLQAGNDISDDHLPVILNNVPVPKREEITVAQFPVVTEPAPITNEPIVEDADTVQEVKAAAEPVLQPVTEPGNKAPQFIDNIELGNEKTLAAAPPEPESNNSRSAIENTTVAIINSDCPTTMSDREFQRLYDAITDKRTEEEKLGVLLEHKKRCYTLAMTEKIAKVMHSDAARYTVLKHLYPRIADQAGFPRLESLFQSNDWKAHFRELAQNK